MRTVLALILIGVIAFWVRAVARHIEKDHHHIDERGKR